MGSRCTGIAEAKGTKMKKTIRWIILVTLIAAGVIAGVLWWRSRQQDTGGLEALRTAEVTRGTLRIDVSASGSIVVERRTELTFDTTGIVESVAVEVGDRVTRGQELARLDTQSLTDAVLQSELEVARAELNLTSLQRPADENRVELAKLAIQEGAQAMAVATASETLARARASSNVERAQELEADVREAYESYLETLNRMGLPDAFAAGITASYMEAQGNVGITQVKSEQAIQQARSQWLAGNHRYEQARYNLAQLEAGPSADQLQQLELQLDQTRLNLERAQADLASATLVAPFDGVIASVTIQAGSAASSALPAVTILDDSHFYAEIIVDEIDIGTIVEGQPALVTLDALPGVSIDGVVDRVGMIAQNMGGVIVYQVRVSLSESDAHRLRAGMTASAQLTTGERTDALLIPNWAVRTDQTSDQVYTYCYCVAGDEAAKVPIQVGARNDTFTEVLSGLSEGQVVALVSESQDLLQFQGPPSRGQP